MPPERKVNMCTECHRKYDAKRGPYNKKAGRHIKLGEAQSLFAEVTNTNFKLANIHTIANMQTIKIDDNDNNWETFVPSRGSGQKTAIQQGFVGLGQTAVTLNPRDALRLGGKVIVQLNRIKRLLALIPVEETAEGYIVGSEKKSPSYKVSLPSHISKSQSLRILPARKPITWHNGAIVIPLD